MEVWFTIEVSDRGLIGKRFRIIVWFSLCVGFVGLGLLTYRVSIILSPPFITDHF